MSKRIVKGVCGDRPPFLMGGEKGGGVADGRVFGYARTQKDLPIGGKVSRRAIAVTNEGRTGKYGCEYNVNKNSVPYKPSCFPALVGGKASPQRGDDRGGGYPAAIATHSFAATFASAKISLRRNAATITRKATIARSKNEYHFICSPKYSSPTNQNHNKKGAVRPI